MAFMLTSWQIRGDNKIVSMRLRNALTACVLLCAAVAPGIIHAESAEWELGVGLTTLDINFYPGSSQRKTYVLPIPYIFYRSERLSIDDGIDATLFRTNRTRFNLSADFGVPVNSKDSDVRAGMPDIDLVLQAGPSLEITLAGGRFQASHLRLEIPLRAAIATDFGSAEAVGWTSEPRLTYETRRPHRTGFAYQVSAGLRFSTTEFHQYYYEVEPAFVTPTRQAFDANGGYSGLFVNYIANWRTDDLIFFAFLRYQNINQSAFEDSPLVEQDDYLMFGVGMAWVFARNL